MLVFFYVNCFVFNKFIIKLIIKDLWTEKQKGIVFSAVCKIEPKISVKGKNFKNVKFKKVL